MDRSPLLFAATTAAALGLAYLWYSSTLSTTTAKRNRRNRSRRGSQKCEEEEDEDVKNLPAIRATQAWADQVTASMPAAAGSSTSSSSSSSSSSSYYPAIGGGGGPTPAMKAAIHRKIDEHTRAVTGFGAGDRVRSLVASDHWHPRPLRAGDAGVVAGPAPAPFHLLVKFDASAADGLPPVEGHVHFHELCQEEDYRRDGGRSKMGGFSPGDTVRSLITPPRSWQIQVNFALSEGDYGVVEGLSPAAQPGQLSVYFVSGGGRPDQRQHQHQHQQQHQQRIRLYVNFADVSLERDWEGRIVAARAAHSAAERAALARLEGKFKVGDRVRSLVAGDHWQPRSLRVGDEGTVVGTAPPPHHLMVDFGGTPPLVGAMCLHEVAVQRARHWPPPLDIPADLLPAGEGGGGGGGGRGRGAAGASGKAGEKKDDDDDDDDTDNDDENNNEEAGDGPMIPASLRCPISHEIMREPTLVTTTGQTYERAMISRWVKEHHSDPSAPSESLQLSDLVPNLHARAAIEEFLAKHRQEKDATKKNKKKEKNNAQ